MVARIAQARTVLSEAVDRKGLARYSYAFTAVGLLVVLLILAAVRGPKLFTVDGLTIAFAVATPLILATMALTPIAISGRGGVDLSIGPLLGFLNVTTIQWLVGHGITSPAAIVAFVLGMGVGVYLIQGLLVAVLRLQPVVVTLSGYLILAGLNLVILPQPAGGVPDWLTGLASDYGGFPAAALVLAGVFLLWWPIGRSTFFRNVRLLGFNERAAFASGIPLIRTRVGAYMLGGLLAGVAGLMFTALIGSGDPNQGGAYTLTAITALVLGGTSLAGGAGGMVGSVAGALDVYLIQYVLATFQFGRLTEFVNQLSNGAILLLSLILGAVVIAYVSRRRTA